MSSRTIAFPEKTRYHYSAFLVYGLKTIFDELRQGNIDEAWTTIKVFALMLPRSIREPVWKKINETEKEAERISDNIRGVDAWTTLRRKMNAKNSVLEEKIHEIIMDIMNGIEDYGLIYEKYVVEVEE